MDGVHWVIRNRDQQKRIMNLIFEQPFPFQVQVKPVASPKSTPQVRYAHGLCNALAAHHGKDPADAKRDAKINFGVITVDTCMITGERRARLKSFADYTRTEMHAFLTAMEAYMAAEGIQHDVR